MRKFFRPLSKRDGKIASVIIGVILLYGIITVVQDLVTGMTFDEVRSSVLILILGAIIEYAMIVIGFGKDKNANEEAEETEETEVVEETAELTEGAEITDISIEENNENE